MMLLWHTDSSINHIHNHNHNHSRQSSFDQSIARATARLSPTSNSNQPRTRSSGSLIESMPTKRQRHKESKNASTRVSVTHLDLESIEQSLASRRGALVYCCQPDDRRIIERERERERGRELELQMEDAITLSRSRSRAHNHAHRGATCLRNGRSGL